MIPASVRSVASLVADTIDYNDEIIKSISRGLYLVGGPLLDGFENLCIKIAPDLVAAARAYAKNNWDPYILTLPCSDPVTQLFWLVFYFVAILVLLLVGKMLAYPSSLRLKGFTIFHSITMCLLSLYMGIGIFSNAIASNYSLCNNSCDRNDRRFTRMTYLFIMSKIPEFLDSFIMALKGSARQLSVLHLVHHSTIFPLTIYYAFPCAQGDSYYSSGLNSFPIHFVMYGVYALSGFAGQKGALRAFIEQHKFKITQMQITQFVIIFLFCAYGLAQYHFVGPSAMKFKNYNGQVAMCLYMGLMVSLFGKFLFAGKKEQSKKVGEAAAAAAAASEGGEKSSKKSSSSSKKDK